MVDNKMNTNRKTRLLTVCSNNNILFGVFLLLSIIFCVVASTDTTSAENVKPSSVEAILAGIFPPEYDKNTRPMIKNSTFNIETALYVDDMSRELWNDFLVLILNLKLTQSWTDDRLRPFTNNQSGNPKSSLIIPQALQERFWLPGTGFSLDAEFKVFYSVMEVFSNGTVNYEQFVKNRVYCPIEYTLFPMDQPNCTLYFGSTQDSSLQYSWKADRRLSFDYFPELPMPGLIVLGYTRRAQPLDGYSHLLVDIFLGRKFFFHLTRFYLPCFSLVVVAFLPLYLTPESHSRVGAGVGSVISITMLLASASAELPNIGQLTFLDIYMFACFFAVVLSVIEFALIGHYDVIRSKEVADQSGLSKREEELLRKIETAEKRSNQIDHLSRQFFPASFAVFNLVYAVASIGILMYNDRVFIEYKV